MATHSSILAWSIPWTEEPGRLQSTGRKESDMTEHLSALHPLAVVNMLDVIDSFVIVYYLLMG